MKPQKQISVVVNPYHALDADGMPATLVMMDPQHGRPGQVQFIGANITHNPDAGDKRLPMWRRRAKVVKFMPNPIKIALSAYHKEQVAVGALIVADEESAKACGVKFEPVRDVLDAAAKKAAAEFEKLHEEAPPVEAWSSCFVVKEN